jgi:hypothetical protein
LTSCISKKEITTQVVDCIPSDSCTFHFTITETYENIVDPVLFFNISLLPIQGIGGSTDFDGECKFTIKRNPPEKNIKFLYSYFGPTDTISIETNDCEKDYFLTYDLPQWFKDSLNALPAPKIIKQLPCRF